MLQGAVASALRARRAASRRSLKMSSLGRELRRLVGWSVLIPQKEQRASRNGRLISSIIFVSSKSKNLHERGHEIYVITKQHRVLLINLQPYTLLNSFREELLRFAHEISIALMTGHRHLDVQLGSGLQSINKIDHEGPFALHGIQCAGSARRGHSSDTSPGETAGVLIQLQQACYLVEQEFSMPLKHIIGVLHPHIAQCFQGSGILDCGP